MAVAQKRVIAQDRELVETARLSFTIKHVFISVMDIFYFFVCVSSDELIKMNLFFSG